MNKRNSSQYSISFTNHILLIRLLNIISKNFGTISKYISEFPKSYQIRGNTDTLETLYSLPVKYSSKVFNWQIVEKEEEFIQRKFKLKKSADNLVRTYRNCLFAFESDIKIHNQNVINLILKN